MNRAKLKTLVLINWRGIFYQPFDMDSLMTSLTGLNGAGKTTVMSAIYVSLLPDKSLIDLRSQAGKGVSTKKQGLYGKFGEGSVSYSVIELISPVGERLLAGVQIRKKQAPEFEMIPFLIRGIDAEINIDDIFLLKEANSDTVIDSDSQSGFSKLVEVIKHRGGRLSTFKGKVGDYMSSLYELGLMPMRFHKIGERKKFNKLLQTSLFGGLSGEIQQSLKEYLLDKDNTISMQISRAESNLATCRQTRDAIERTEKNRQLIEKVYSSASTMAASVIADLDSKYLSARDFVVSARREFKDHTSKLKENKIRISELEQSIDLKVTQIEKIESKIIEFKTAFDCRKQADDLVARVRAKRKLISDQKVNLEKTSGSLEKLQMLVDEVRRDKTEIGQQRDLVVNQLVDVNETFNIETKKASLYKAAINAKKNYENIFSQHDDCLDDLVENKAKLEIRRNEIIDETYQIKIQVEEFNRAKQHFDEVFRLVKLLAELVPKDVFSELTEDNAFECSEKIISFLVGIQTELKDLEFHENSLNQALIQLTNADHVGAVAKNYEIKSSNAYIDKMVDLENRIDSLKNKIGEIEASISATESEKYENEAYYKQIVSDEKKFQKAKATALVIEDSLGVTLHSIEDLEDSKKTTEKKKQELSEDKIRLTIERQSLGKRISDLQSMKTFDDERLVELAGELGGELLSDLLDHLELDQAAIMEAKLGPLRQAISVEDPEKSLNEFFKCQSKPDEVYFVNKTEIEKHLSAELIDGRAVVKESASMRVSKVPKNPTLGADARDRETDRLARQLNKISERLVDTEIAYEKVLTTEKLIYELESLGHLYFSHNSIISSSDLSEKNTLLISELDKSSQRLAKLQAEHDGYLNEFLELKKFEHLTYLLDAPNLTEKIKDLKLKIEKLNKAESKYSSHFGELDKLIKTQSYLKFDPSNTPARLSKLLVIRESEKKELTASMRVVEEYQELKGYLRYHKSSQRIVADESLTEDLTKEKTQLETELERVNEKYNTLSKEMHGFVSKKEIAQELIKTYDDECRQLESDLSDLNVDDSKASLSEIEADLITLEKQKSELSVALSGSKSESNIVSSDMQHLEKTLENAREKYLSARSNKWYPTKVRHRDVFKLIRQYPFFDSIQRKSEQIELSHLTTLGTKSMTELKAAFIDQCSGHGSLGSAIVVQLEKLLSSPFGANPLETIELFIQIHGFMEQQLPRDIVDSDDPVEALASLSLYIQKLRLKLKHHETDFSTSSNDVAYGIEQKIRKEFRSLARLNQGLDKVRFGNISAIQIKYQKKTGMDQILQALLAGGNNVPMFNQKDDVSFEEALEKLYETHIGKKFSGGSLLDFRYYVDLQVQIKRKGSQVWENADSNRLSTGESIGVGLSILIMVLQSWETNTMRITGKRHLSLRFLFLDEASRLDISSINTLSSLCSNMGLQLMIAAPSADEVISGTTYCLNRVVDAGGGERVIVRGIRGFSSPGIFSDKESSRHVMGAETKQKRLEFTEKQSINTSTKEAAAHQSL